MTATAEAKTKPKLAEVAMPERMVPPLKGGTLRLFDFQQNRFSTVFASDSLASDYLGPDLWAVVAGELHAYDVVSGPTGDAKFWREYLCVSAVLGNARFVLLQEIRLPARDRESEQRVPKHYRIRAGCPEDEMNGDMYVIDREPHDGIDELIGVNRGCQHKTFEQALRWLVDSAILRATQTTRYS
jgi:hypothetical protein